MATVVCNKNCQYRKAAFCGKDFVMLNQFGQCSEWFAKNGQPKIIFDFNRCHRAKTARYTVIRRKNSD